jgi:hypothetical protein
MGSVILLCLHGVPFGPQDDLGKKKHSGLCMDHPVAEIKPKFWYLKDHIEGELKKIYIYI